MSEPVQTPKPRRGCLFYGSIAAVLCLVVILVVFLLAVQMFKKGLNQFTDTKPAPLPRLQLSAAQLEQVQRRVEAFEDAVSAGRPTPSLELSSDDLNAVVATRSDSQSLTNKVYLQVAGDKVQAEVSMPMDQLGFRFLKGRYFNGLATFSVSIENGLLRIAPEAVTVKGKPLPDAYTQTVARTLARSVNDNSKASIALNRLEKIEVKDGKVIFLPKQLK